MVKDNISFLMVIYFKDILKKGKNLDKDLFYLQMDVNLKGNGFKIKVNLKLYYIIS